MIINQSNLRLNHLQQVGQKLDIYSDNVPDGLSEDQSKMQQKRQKVILEYYRSDLSDWNNWQWQMSHRIQSVEEISELLSFTPSQLKSVSVAAKHFRFSISPYYLSLMNWSTLDSDPISLMSLPNEKELCSGGDPDPSAEMQCNPAGCIVRRYPNRAIIQITNCCASFCRHCQRKRGIGSHDSIISPDELRESIQYIEQHNEIHDVLITGGDALTLTDLQLYDLLLALRKIDHVEIIRLGSRMLVNMPQRITSSLVQILAQFAPIYINTQFNHPLEITTTAITACNALTDNGVILGNQMVLLNGVNNDKYVVQQLNSMLLSARIRPYYIFHPKNVQGTLHFQTSITEGIDILSYLWGNCSGLSIPRYIVSAPNGLGKIEVTPDTLLRKRNGCFNLTTWEGVNVCIPDKYEI